MQETMKLWDLHRDIVATMSCMRMYDQKAQWNAEDKATVTMMLRNLKTYTAKITEHYQRDRHLQV